MAESYQKGLIHHIFNIGRWKMATHWPILFGGELQRYLALSLVITYRDELPDNLKEVLQPGHFYHHTDRSPIADSKVHYSFEQLQRLHIDPHKITEYQDALS